MAETTIDSLNQQLVELSRSESLARAKEQHESVVNAMKRRHEEEVLTLKQKLDEAVLSRDHKVPFLVFFEYNIFFGAKVLSNHVSGVKLYMRLYLSDYYFNHADQKNKASKLFFAFILSINVR